MGLALYPEDALEGVDVEVRFGQELLELGVLAFQLFQPPGVGYVHAAELGPPLVERGVAEAAFAAELLDRHPGLGLLEKANDLFIHLVQCPNRPERI